MRERLNLTERIGLGRTRLEERTFSIEGRLTVQRYDRATGEFLGETTANNTITNKDLIIDVLDGTLAVSNRFGTGASGTGTAWLMLSATEGGPLSSGITGTWYQAPTSIAEVTASNSNGTRIRWVFEDNSADTYAATCSRLWNGNPASSPTTWYISNIAATLLGTKPPSQNWHYYYEIELYSSDTDIKAAGTGKMMRIINGNVGYVAVTLGAATTTMQPLDASLVAVGSAITASSKTQPTTTSMEFTFVSADGNNNGTWTNSRVQASGTSTDTLREGGCKQDGTSCGVKASGEEWTYKWRFTLS